MDSFPAVLFGAYIIRYQYVDMSCAVKMLDANVIFVRKAKHASDTTRGFSTKFRFQHLINY